jgi:hypothetical protein
MHKLFTLANQLKRSAEENELWPPFDAQRVRSVAVALRDVALFEPRVDAAGAFLLWCPSEPLARTHWAGPLGESPPGLIVAASATGGDTTFYVYTAAARRAYAKAPNVQLHVLHTMRTAQGAACSPNPDAQREPKLRTTMLPAHTHVECLSSTPAGAPCPLPLRVASVFPFLLNNALVDASVPWSGSDLRHLLACFRNVYFYNGDGSDFSARLKALTGVVPSSGAGVLAGLGLAVDGAGQSTTLQSVGFTLTTTEAPRKRAKTLHAFTDAQPLAMLPPALALMPPALAHAPAAEATQPDDVEEAQDDQDAGVAYAELDADLLAHFEAERAHMRDTWEHDCY